MRVILMAVGRLAVMAVVMAVVLAGSIFAGLATMATVALAVVVAGLVGLLGVTRRSASMRTPATADGLVEHPAVAAMAPDALVVDPEANMPRWRRPSLLEARRADPTRLGHSERSPLQFGAGTAGTGTDVRSVRYAVVGLLDRPDEVFGQQLADLVAGDEVRVVGGTGAFVEVQSVAGERGWLHRTTLSSPRSIEQPAVAHRAPLGLEADDALSALLTARGLQ